MDDASAAAQAAALAFESRRVLNANGLFDVSFV